MTKICKNTDEYGEGNGFAAVETEEQRPVGEQSCHDFVILDSKFCLLFFPNSFET
jgi:hypothetical protein